MYQTIVHIQLIPFIKNFDPKGRSQTLILKSTASADKNTYGVFLTIGSKLDTSLVSKGQLMAKSKCTQILL